MSEETDVPNLESCIAVAGDEWRYTPDEIAVLEAELAELRRKAWNWDEARAIANGTIPFRQRQIEIAVLVAGDGDAEWQTKAHQGGAPTPTVTGESGGGQ
jgi:hypothetical protein